MYKINDKLTMKMYLFNYWEKHDLLKRRIIFRLSSWVLNPYTILKFDQNKQLNRDF